MNPNPEVSKRVLPVSATTIVATLSAVLALGLGASPAGAQQTQPSQETQPSKPAIQIHPSVDVIDPSAPPELTREPSQNMAPAQAGQPEQATLPANQPVPATLSLPKGTLISVRLNDWLSSDKNHRGDVFTATLDQPLVVHGLVIARRGQSLLGHVEVAQKAGHGGSSASQLGAQLDELTLVDGQQLPVQTQLFETSAGTSNGRSAAMVGTTTGVGAIIGAAAEGGAEGAGIGAIAGVTAGVVAVLSTRGKPTVIPSEALLTFRLEAPLAISTQQSQWAFRPVTQSDYAPSLRRTPPPQVVVAPPPYYSAPYYYDYWGYPYYGVPFYFGGFYGGFEFGGYAYGHRFGGFRGGFWR